MDHRKLCIWIYEITCLKINLITYEGVLTVSIHLEHQRAVEETGAAYSTFWLGCTVSVATTWIRYCHIDLIGTVGWLRDIPREKIGFGVIKHVNKNSFLLFVRERCPNVESETSGKVEIPY